MMKIGLFTALICIAECYQSCYNIATCDQMPNGKCFCSYNCSAGCVMLPGGTWNPPMCINNTYSIPQLKTYPYPAPGWGYKGINQTIDLIYCPIYAYVTKSHNVPPCAGIVSDICVNSGLSPWYPGAGPTIYTLLNIVLNTMILCVGTHMSTTEIRVPKSLQCAAKDKTLGLTLHT